MPTITATEPPNQNWLDVLDSFLIIGLFAVLPLEHTPAARNTLCVLIGLRGCWLLTKHQDSSFLEWSWPILPWLAWASFSYFWSAAPKHTFSGLQHDLWMPLLTYLGAYQVFHKRNSIKLLLWATAVGTIANTFVTLFGADFAGYAIYKIDWVEYFFTTTGYSSTYALYFSAIALPWLFWRQMHYRVSTGALIAFNLAAAIVDKNRIFFVAEAAMVALLFLCGIIKLSRKAILMGSVATMLALAFLVHVNQLRTGVVPSNESSVTSFMRHIQDDPRPKIWGLWTQKALESPLIGHGFGRDVPAAALSIEERQHFSVDTYATLHSHNLFLQTLLETGWIGVICITLMLSSFAWRFSRALKSNRYVATTGLILLAAMLMKNLTDIFTLFGPAVLFYSALGAISACIASTSSEENTAPLIRSN